MASTSEQLRALHERQYEFAAHLRDPERNAPPGDIEARRMAIYSELFFNNVVSFLGGHFPIAKQILGDDNWRSLLRDYYRDHNSHAPLFPDMPREFLSYLSDERNDNPAAENDPPWLYELCHYEWVESGLMLAPDDDRNLDIDPTGDLLEQPPALVQPAWLLAYTYPVNEISVEQQPDAPAEQPLHYLVYRNADDKVKFIKLNIVSARLYELLQSDSQLTGRSALEKIAAELQQSNVDAVVSSGAQILDQWRASGVIAGSTR